MTQVRRLTDPHTCNLASGVLKKPLSRRSSSVQKAMPASVNIWFSLCSCSTPAATKRLFRFSTDSSIIQSKIPSIIDSRFLRTHLKMSFTMWLWGQMWLKEHFSAKAQMNEWLVAHLLTQSLTCTTRGGHITRKPPLSLNRPLLKAMLTKSLLAGSLVHPPTHTDTDAHQSD